MRLKVSVIFLLLFLPVSLLAEYKDNIIKGNEAYGNKNWPEALKFYKQAYEEKQSQRLADMIAALEKLSYPRTLNEKPVDWAPVIVIGTDAVLAAAAICSFVYEKQMENEYDEMYSKYNGTTPENREKLLEKQKETYYAMTYETLAITALGAALVYTAGDIFFAHNVFFKGQAFSPEIKPGYAGVAYKGRF